MPAKKAPTQFDDPAPPPNMEDDQTMPGFDEDDEDTGEATQLDDGALARQQDEGDQGTYLAPAPGQPPPGYIMPPSLDSFANATYLPAGPEIDRIVDRVMAFDELADLGDIEFMVLWRRQGTPGGKDNRRFAGVELVDALPRYIAAQLEAGPFPQYVINLYWLHLDELRNDSQYMHPDILARHILQALLRLDVSESGVLTLRGGLEPEQWATVVKHYGLVTQGLVSLQRQMALWG